jgi:hypothetical protein
MNDVEVIYCAESFQGDHSSLSAILKNIRRAEAADYSRDFSVKIFNGQCNLARRGYSLGGNPRPRPFAYRTSENQHPLMKSWGHDRKRSKQEEKRSQWWSNIVRRVAEIECAVGTSVLKNNPNRDSMRCVSFRLAFLTGYLESQAELGRTSDMRDITPEPERDESVDDVETAGNLVCPAGCAAFRCSWRSKPTDALRPRLVVNTLTPPGDWRVHLFGWRREHNTGGLRGSL